MAVPSRTTRPTRNRVRLESGFRAPRSQNWVGPGESRGRPGFLLAPWRSPRPSNLPNFPAFSAHSAKLTGKIRSCLVGSTTRYDSLFPEAGPGWQRRRPRVPASPGAVPADDEHARRRCGGSPGRSPRSPRVQVSNDFRRAFSKHHPGLCTGRGASSPPFVRATPTVTRPCPPLPGSRARAKGKGPGAGGLPPAPCPESELPASGPVYPSDATDPLRRFQDSPRRRM